MFYKNTILVVFLWVWAFFYEGHGFYFTIIISTDCNTYYKKEYKSLLLKQYQNLSYKIKDEKIDNNTANVEVEIEVFDYYNTLERVKEDIDKNSDDFKDDNDKSSKEKIEEYKIKKLKATTNKTKYQIIFTLTKKDGKWTLDKLSDDDIKKIHGLIE